MRLRLILPLLTGLVLAGGALAEHTDRAYKFGARLSGNQEVPPNDSATGGFALFHVDRNMEQMRFRLVVRRGENLLGANGAHLHCAPEGVNGPVVAFLAGETPPGFDGKIDLRASLTDASIIPETDCGTTLADLVEAMLDGNVYVNVHSADFPGGVVRGQVFHPSHD